MTAITPQRRAYVRWCIRHELTEEQAVALLTGLGRAGFILDTTPGDAHLRLHTGEGWARIAGLDVLARREPAKER